MELTIKIETKDVMLPGNLRQEVGLQFAVADKDGRVWQDHVVARGKDTKAAVFSLAGQARLARSIAHMVGIVIENDTCVAASRPPEPCSPPGVPAPGVFPSRPYPNDPAAPNCSAFGCVWEDLELLSRVELRELVLTNGFAPGTGKLGNIGKQSLLDLIKGVIEEID
jgi:hypothetical protein